VRALFLRRPEQVLRLFYTEDRRRLVGPLCSYLSRSRRPYREVPPDELARIAGTQHHGGVCAVAAGRLATILLGTALPPLPAAEFLPVLDGIGNPHNLGAIARSAAFFGARAMLLSDDARQADLSDAAYRTAEGGLEHLEVHRARDLPGLLRGMRDRVLTVAAVAAGGLPPDAIPRDRPIALVLGNEEHGPPPATLEACEARLTLPGSGLVESLNVSAAAAVLFQVLGAPPRTRP
jgi:TrmH RNA methyltransferase